jgi:hypothetical protein
MHPENVYLIGKVHMPWSVDQVQHIVLPILGMIIHACSLDNNWLLAQSRKYMRPLAA